MRKDGKAHFGIDAREINEKEKDLIIDMHCPAPFATSVLVEAIMQINERVNATGLLEVKNGFWLILQEAVNERLQEEDNGIK